MNSMGLESTLVELIEILYYMVKDKNKSKSSIQREHKILSE